MDKIKSLQQELGLLTDDEAKLDVLLQLTDRVMDVHIENAFNYARQAEALAAALQHAPGKAEAKRLLGMCYHNQGAHFKALECLAEAKQLLGTANNIRGMIDTLSNTGVVYLALTELDEAIAEFEQAFTLCHLLGDPNMIAKLYNNLSIPYKTRGNFDKAIQLLDQCITTYVQAGDAKGLLNARANLAGVYVHMHKYHDALPIFIECAPEYKKHSNRLYYAYTLMNIGTCYHSVNDFTNSLKYQQMALKEFQALGSKHDVAAIYNDMGNSLTGMGGYAEAEKYFLRSMGILMEEGNLGETYCISCHSMGCVALLAGDLEKAEKYLLKAHGIATEKSLARILSEAHKSLAELYAQTGDNAKRKQYLSLSAAN